MRIIKKRKELPRERKNTDEWRTWRGPQPSLLGGGGKGATGLVWNRTYLHLFLYI